MSKIIKIFCVLILVLGFVLPGSNFSYALDYDDEVAVPTPADYDPDALDPDAFDDYAVSSPPPPPLPSGSCITDSDCNQNLCEQCINGTCTHYCAEGECCNKGVCTLCGEPLPPEMKMWTHCLTDANCTEGLKCVNYHEVPPVMICAECGSGEDCFLNIPGTCANEPCNGFEEQAPCDRGFYSNGTGCCCEFDVNGDNKTYPYCDENYQCKYLRYI